MEIVSEVEGIVCGRGEDCHLCRQDAERWFCDFNLAPLSRFLPAPEGVRENRVAVCDDRGRMYWRDTGNVVRAGDCAMFDIYLLHKPRAELAKMYGWPFEEEPQQPKKPEPSPIDREIERMMERRKAKRERFNSGPGDLDDAWVKEVDREIAEADRAKALKDAMSKIPPHIAMLQERGTYWGRR